jgi:hypothetical protein
MIKLKGTTAFIIYSMLFFPLLGHLYIGLNFPKTISILFTFLVFFIGFNFLLRYQGVLKFPKFLMPLVLYMIYIPVRSHLSVLPERHILTQIYHDILHISIFFILLIIYNTKFNLTFIRFSIKIFKVTIIASAIGSLIQVFDPTFLKYGNLMSGDIYTLRRSSIFTYVTLGLGFSFIPLLSVTVGYLNYTKRRIPLFYLIIGGISSILSNTRFIMVGYFLLVAQLIVVDRKKLNKQFKYGIIFVFIIGFFFYFLSYLGYNFSDWYEERLLAEGSIEYTTRYMAFDNFFRFFPDVWFLGNGQYNAEEVRKASNAIGSSQIHVGYLAHLVSYGIVGSLFLFSFWFLLVKRLLRTAKLTNYWGSFFAFLTYLWAQATLVHYSIFYYGLIFAFVFDKYVYDNYLELKNKSIKLD